MFSDFLWLLAVIYIRTGVENTYSEREHLLQELLELHQAEEDRKEMSAAAKKKQDGDNQLGKEMREASLQAYAVSQAAKRTHRKFCSFHSLLLNLEIHTVASSISCFLSFHLENSKS